ncbi:hypothetical protein MRS44_002365 [Fusarium solani]|uniref:uncharacterized protein n=1 Tax=Fusarium solani TaxID=169388 RepID=UPI0032C47963|nr:hypothetical protein MRS44_002365 [Fusarium solani]
MRTVIPLLQLLALAHQAAASVCRPRVTSSSVSVESVTTSASTAASSTVSSTGSESTTWSSTETASSSTETVSLSTTETASSSTESASLSTTDSSTVVSTTSSASESISSDSSTITSSTLFTSTTSTAEASSTTSSVPEGPPELLINRGFEDKDSLSPWQQRPVCPPNLVIPPHPRGQYDYNTGVVQPVPASKVVADTQYEFSAWVKLSPSMRCQNFYIACSIGDGFMPGSFQATAVPGVGGWLQLKTTCQWSQIWLNAGPGVAVIGQCTEADYYVDDASFKLVV